MFCDFLDNEITVGDIVRFTDILYLDPEGCDITQKLILITDIEVVESYNRLYSYEKATYIDYSSKGGTVFYQQIHMGTINDSVKEHLVLIKNPEFYVNNEEILFLIDFRNGLRKRKS